MQSKILLLFLSVAGFSSCSTAYKTGQTPDDVYYSPVKPVAEKRYTQKEEDRQQVNNDYEITMVVRDYRWRNFRQEYEFDNSPYNYCYCNCKSTGYYYNPYYYPWAIYTSTPSYAVKLNSTPRMVNLNAYNGYSPRVASGKTNGTLTFSNVTTPYNNSNRSGSRLREVLRQTVEPTPPSSSSSNNTRSYTPSSSGSSGSSSSGSSSSGSVSRPGRGG